MSKKFESMDTVVMPVILKCRTENRTVELNKAELNSIMSSCQTAIQIQEEQNLDELANWQKESILDLISGLTKLTTAFHE